MNFNLQLVKLPELYSGNTKGKRAVEKNQLSWEAFCDKVVYHEEIKVNAMDNHIFRSALSGFNRQDVMTYIEKTQKEAAEQIAALEARAQELREKGDINWQALKACTAERDDLSRQLEDMTLRYNHAKNNWDAQAAAKESFRADVAQRDETIRDLTAENQTLFHRVQELEDQVAAFRQEKEKVAQLELEARERSAAAIAQAQAEAQDTQRRAGEEAQAALTEARKQAEALISQAESQAKDIVSQAQVRAQAIRRESEERVAGAASQCRELFSSFDTIASHVSGELRKMDVTAAQLPISLNHLRDSLDALLEKAKEK